MNNLAIRICDLLFSLVLLVFASIPLMMISLAIWVFERQSPFFVQRRVGKDCQEFDLFKFRTMVVDPQRFMGAVDESSPDQNQRAAFQTTSENDPRITRIGRVLRPAHLDELPQIFNVLFGQMSLVGVRPDVPVQRFDYSQVDWEARHKLRPGITGLAQVSEEVNSSETRLACDLDWVNNPTFGRYCRILLKTFLKVFRFNSL